MFYEEFVESGYLVTEIAQAILILYLAKSEDEANLSSHSAAVLVCNEVPEERLTLHGPRRGGRSGLALPLPIGGACLRGGHGHKVALFPPTTPT